MTSSWALIIVLGTNLGMTTVTTDFYSEINCRQAGLSIIVDAVKKGATVTTWGCYPR